MLVFLMMTGYAQAARHGRRYKKLPDSEGELVGRVLKCLQNQDTIGYFNLFPPFDSLWQMVMHNPDHTPEAQAQLSELKEHPRTLVEFDPYYNPSIMERFGYVLKKGNDSGINWSNIVLARYELEKAGPTRGMTGFDKVAPERFIGYVFIRDIGERSTFCVTLSEIQKFKGAFVGGQVNNIMEASTIEEYNRRVEYERNYYVKALSAGADSAIAAAKADSLHNDSLKRGYIKIAKTDSSKVKADSLAKKKAALMSGAAPDDDTLKIRREVVDRKYYEGKFDDEIPVELFVRYMRDPQNGSVMYWDALYKFGDQQNYIKLEVTKNGDKWEFDDDPPVGSMELYLKNKVYTGTWINNESQSGYDAVMKETAVAPRKLEKMEKILEEGLSGRSDDPSAQEPAETGKKKKGDAKKKSDKKKPARDDDE